MVCFIVFLKGVGDEFSSVQGGDSRPCCLGYSLSCLYWNLCAFIVIGLVSTKPFLFLLSIPVLVVEHFIAITDPNAFRIWALHIKLNIRRKIIKGSDSFYSQFNYRGDRK